MSTLAVGTRVRVIDDAARAEALAEGHGEWDEEMAVCCGLEGTVHAVSDQGIADSVTVHFGPIGGDHSDHEYFFNYRALYVVEAAPDTPFSGAARVPGPEPRPNAFASMAAQFASPPSGGGGCAPAGGGGGGSSGKKGKRKSKRNVNKNQNR